MNLGSRRKVNVYLRSASPFRLPIWLSYIRLLPNPSGGSVDKRANQEREQKKHSVWREYILGGEQGGLGRCRGLAAGSEGGGEARREGGGSKL